MEKLNEYRKIYDEDPVRASWSSIAEAFAHLSLLEPSKRDQLELTAKEWEYIMEELHRDIKKIIYGQDTNFPGDWSSIIDLLAATKVLGTENARITPEGELVIEDVSLPALQRLPKRPQV